MCGIFGFAGSLSIEVATICTNRLAHRGPDGQGIRQYRGAVLGHRRLAILDLTTDGDQPFSDAQGRYHIVFNGEIYNFLELRGELEKQGVHFKSQSDTEVLLAAYIHWGEDFLSRLNGMWSFAIWDELAQSLFLSRDRLGKKPLFYAITKNGLAFASEMKALLPLLDNASVDEALVRDRSRYFTYEASEDCLIQEIKRLPAGHCATWNGVSLKKWRWWEHKDHSTLVPQRYEEQVEFLRALLFDACRIRMRSDVPLGAALSGGLDSSSICAMVAQNNLTGRSARLSREKQKSFIASFPGSFNDETDFAVAVSRHLDIEPCIVHINAEREAGMLLDRTYLFEELYISCPSPFMATYEAVAQKKIKVTLDGHGADELFCGYPVDVLKAFGDAPLNPLAHFEILRTYFGANTSAMGVYGRSMATLRAAMKQYFREGRHLLKTRQVPEGVDAALRRLTYETVLPTLLRNYDRYSMSQGVEIRMPFLDYRIVSFAFSIPWTSKIRNGFTKAILRDAVAPFLPKDIVRRRAKIGFNPPMTDWMRGPMRAFFLDHLASSAFKSCNLIDPAKVTLAVERIMKGEKRDFAAGENAWTLIAPYFWELGFLKRASLKC